MLDLRPIVQTGRLGLVSVAALAVLILVLSGFESKFKLETGEKQRSAGALGLGATDGFVGAETLGWKPTAVEVINDSSNNIQLGVRWYKDSSNSVQTYTPDLPGGTSLDLGGAEVDSVWVNHAGASSSSDSLYWTAAR